MSAMFRKAIFTIFFIRWMIIACLFTLLFGCGRQRHEHSQLSHSTEEEYGTIINNSSKEQLLITVKPATEGHVRVSVCSILDQQEDFLTAVTDEDGRQEVLDTRLRCTKNIFFNESGVPAYLSLEVLDNVILYSEARRFLSINSENATLNTLTLMLAIAAPSASLISFASYDWRNFGKLVSIGKQVPFITGVSILVGTGFLLYGYVDTRQKTQAKVQQDFWSELTGDSDLGGRDLFSGYNSVQQYEILLKDKTIAVFALNNNVFKLAQNLAREYNDATILYGVGEKIPKICLITNVDDYHQASETDLLAKQQESCESVKAVIQ
ncbi:MAG: hypothetical protein OXC40_00820 [Proteobacteria bacterium]|nr:hypothetical protein [Pseudomonadota bacterium]